MKPTLVRDSVLIKQALSLALAGQKIVAARWDTDYVRRMDEIIKSDQPPFALGGEALTPAQMAALMRSFERGEAQFLAGEAIPGEDVFAWLRSWGTAHELPPPGQKSDQG